MQLKDITSQNKTQHIGIILTTILKIPQIDQMCTKLNSVFIVIRWLKHHIMFNITLIICLNYKRHICFFKWIKVQLYIYDNAHPRLMEPTHPSCKYKWLTFCIHPSCNQNEWQSPPTQQTETTDGVYLITRSCRVCGRLGLPKLLCLSESRLAGKVVCEGRQSCLCRYVVHLHILHRVLSETNHGT